MNERLFYSQFYERSVGQFFPLWNFHFGSWKSLGVQLWSSYKLKAGNRETLEFVNLFLAQNFKDLSTNPTELLTWNTFSLNSKSNPFLSEIILKHIQFHSGICLFQFWISFKNMLYITLLQTVEKLVVNVWMIDQYFLLDISQLPSISPDFPGFFRIFSDSLRFPGFSRILPDSPGFSRILPDSPGFFPIFPDSPGFKNWNFPTVF